MHGVNGVKRLGVGAVGGKLRVVVSRGGRGRLVLHVAADMGAPLILQIESQLAAGRLSGRRQFSLLQRRRGRALPSIGLEAEQRAAVDRDEGILREVLGSPPPPLPPLESTITSPATTARPSAAAIR